MVFKEAGSALTGGNSACALAGSSSSIVVMVSLIGAGAGLGLVSAFATAVGLLTAGTALTEGGATAIGVAGVGLSCLTSAIAVVAGALSGKESKAKRAASCPWAAAFWNHALACAGS